MAKELLMKISKFEMTYLSEFDIFLFDMETTGLINHIK